MNIEIFNYTINFKNIIIVILNIGIGFIAYFFLNFLIKRIGNNKNLSKSQKQRILTLKILIKNIIKYLIIIFVIISILPFFGINITSIIAGLGIGTAIIGLAFQDLAKDFIAGVSIITEAKYEIGDTIEVEDFKGEVIEFGLRTTKIRDFKGATKIISNRYMDNIINYSNYNSLAIVDIPVAYEEDMKKVEKTLNSLFKKLNKELEYTTKDIEILGVNELADFGIIYRIAVETKPMKHIAIERILKKEIKNIFDLENIEIPYPKIEVKNGKRI